MALLEARPYRPFKSSEEYLEAMKEDLAEWLSTMYPDLMINAENFMDRLDTGVALCKHANFVRQAAEDYLARRQARNKSMTRSMTSGLAGPILAMGNIHYLPAAKSGTFFARDNVSNFITWCRKSLKIIECLLFETDDLIMRKNEKHVILCLLEVARRGAKFGMLAPMLVQMERQIDREIAADNKANGVGCSTQTDSNATMQTDIGVGTDSVATETDMFDTDSDNDDEDDDGPMLMYGPQPQIITNDLKSLDEMVRDLVEKCTCPSQFPMVRVSEGKYRIGDTKVLIFVRILRSHVMVRVGGGWDTLSHYLDKHDPCRCRAQHRTAIAARLIPRNSNNQSNGIELHKAQVIFERSPPTARKIISSFNNQASPSLSSNLPNSNIGNTFNNSSPYSLSPNFGQAGKNRSRSPTPQRKFLHQQQQQQISQLPSITNVPSNACQVNGEAAHTNVLTSPNLTRRSMSPSPRRLIDMRKKPNSLDSSGPKSLPIVGDMQIVTTANNGSISGNHVQFESLNSSQTDASAANAVTMNNTSNNGTTSESNSNNGSKFENISDNGSEISDEGYRSLGLIQSNAQKRESLHSQASIEDAETNVRLDPTSSDSQLSPTDEAIASNKTLEHIESEFDAVTNAECITIDAACGPQSLPAVLSTPPTTPTTTDDAPNKFEQSGIFISDDAITVDVASATGLRKTGFSNKIFGHESALKRAGNADGNSKIPRSPNAVRRRRSVDDSSAHANSSGSLQDLSTRTGLPVFNRKKPVYRSVRQPPPLTALPTKSAAVVNNMTKQPKTTQQVRDVTNTWSGARTAATKKRPSINETFTPQQRSSSGAAIAQTSNGFERNTRTRSSQILYDSNGRRIKGCTASLTTSPVKHHATSPLAQQLLEAASSAKNDAQILEKMKNLLSHYAKGNMQATTTTTQNPTKLNGAAASSNKKPSAIYEDFTTAWVHSNGNLERSSSCSPPTKTLSKRSSAASSTDSTHSRDIASVIVSPRRDRERSGVGGGVGVSKIPTPVVRRNTELY